MSQVATEVRTTTQFPPFTEEDHMIRQTVKQFCQKEIAPFAEEWDLAGIFSREVFKKAGGLGVLGIRFDPKYGVAGMDWWATTAYMEGMAYADSGSVGMAMMVQSDLTLPVIEELGTAEQKDGFLRAGI